MSVGPDAGRYLIAGRGDPVAFPFNLRWLLPTVCRTSMRRWWIVWTASWPLLAAGAAVWAFQMGATWWEGAAVAALLTALPGVLQPSSTHPVGVDLPAMAVAIWAADRFKPLKVLGSGNLSAKLFVLADSFTDTALTKIKAAGGSTQVLQLPTEESAVAVGVTKKKSAPKKSASETSEPSAGADA